MWKNGRDGSIKLKLSLHIMTVNRTDRRKEAVSSILCTVDHASSHVTVFKTEPAYHGGDSNR